MTDTTSSFQQVFSFRNRNVLLIFAQIEQQKTLLETIRNVLPANIATHVLHCIVNGQKLSLYTDSAAWASQLRFYHNAILKATEAQLKGSVTIVQTRILVGTLSGITFRTTRKPTIPSMEQIEAIYESSRCITDDRLKKSLEKLGATLEKQSSLRSGSG